MSDCNSSYLKVVAIQLMFPVASFLSNTLLFLDVRVFLRLLLHCLKIRFFFVISCDFSKEVFIFFSCNRSITSRTTFVWASSSGEKMIMLSKYTLNVSLTAKSWRIDSMKRWNHAGALLIPIGIDRYSYRPNSQINAVSAIELG